MPNKVTIKLNGKEHDLKFGALSMTRRIRLNKADLSVFDDPELGIDQLYYHLVSWMIPKEDHFWKSEEELLEALEDENEPETLRALIDGFKQSMGFIQTLSEQVGDEGESDGKRKAKM